MITLEDIQAEHSRLSVLIAQLAENSKPSSRPVMLVVPEVVVTLQPGEHYAGLVLDATTGLALHHLVLLPGDRDDITWEDASAWAYSIGGSLPTRQEQALLYANLKRCFEPEWYWSSEQHESNGSCAWGQVFSYGYQINRHKSYAGRARAVRRFAA